ncbi:MULTISPECIES: hypothetical protein [unclassified Colwellia]|uniref:hypothetical protein n=1 Tax=unclassified Colwellia TaxID=196834 RepID=UPI0015F6DBFC|nr:MULTISPECIES: hypothetical protein [unclassified Colwellia]MBA6257659.1 hypothetical protein [Colwellia sp. MB3u-28]MBA6259416.1 hypothetical protein [Colwellia sp. MB3u-41]MBA6304381.1 hypothetical protein [Colwellia sp. MB02u-14]
MVSSKQGQDKLPMAMVSTIDKALNLSNRSGVAWLIYDINNIVTTGASMVGYPQTSLKNDLAKVENAHALYLSCPPYPLFIEPEELYELIEVNGIKQLHIPKIKADWWSELVSNNSIEELTNCHVIEYPINNIGQQIYHGPYTILTKNRPWVKCVTVASMDGIDINLSKSGSYKCIKSIINSIIEKNHAVAIESGTYEKDSIILVNKAKAEIATYEISSVKDFKKTLKFQNLLQQPTLTLIAGTNIMKELLALDLIDEVVYFFLFLNIETIDRQEETRSVMPKLTGWNITDTESFKQGVKISFSRTLF